MQAIALSSRKRTTFFFLIGTGKIKTRQKSTHVDVTSPHPYGFITAGHHLVNSFLRVNFGVGLIHIADLNGFTHLKGSLSTSSCPIIIRNSVVFPAPLGPITPTIPLGGKVNSKPSNNKRSPKALDTSCASITLSPKRGPLGIKISNFSSFCFTSSFKRFS